MRTAVLLCGMLSRSACIDGRLDLSVLDVRFG